MSPQHLVADVRHGLRLFAKSPGFTAIAVLSIAFGTGANVAMFSTVDALLLRPPPVENPRGLLTVGAVDAGEVREVVVASHPDFLDIRARTKTLTSLAAYRWQRAGLATAADAPQQMRIVTAVSGNFFDALGLEPALGRGFLLEEDRVPGRDAVVVLSYGLWKTVFAGNPDALGRPLWITGRRFTVVGVAPEEFTGPDGMHTRDSAYVPLAMLPALMSSPVDPLLTRDLRILTVKARLRPGVRLGAARAELAAIGQGLARAYPATNADRVFAVQTDLEMRISRGPVVASLLFVLTALALAVLGVACANVAGLLTSRAPLRARELGLRLALGAGRGRLVAQLMTESLAIALAGGAGGIAVGYAGIRLIGQLELPTDMVTIPPLAMDQRALMFSLLLAMASAIVFGLGPAFATTRIDLTNALRVAEPAGRGRWRLSGRNGLVALQVALSLVVLTLAIIALQTFVEAFSGGPGFRTTQMAKISLDAGQARYSVDRQPELFARVAEEARRIPGVASVALTSAMPLWELEIARINRRPGATAEGRWATPPFSNVVDEGYFETMEIPVLDGRGFQRTDALDAPAVAVVNETMARRYWPSQYAVGKRIEMAAATGPLPVEIVGIVRDSTYLYPAEFPQNMLYLPLRQHPRPVMTLLAQTVGESATPLPALREAVRRVDPAVPVYDAQTMERFYDALSLSVARVVLTLINGIGLMGVVITVVGLYGLVSYSVNRRTREIGIRVALGATYAAIMRLLLRQGLAPAWVGMGAGIGLSLALARWLPVVAPFSPTYDGWAVAALLPLLFVVTLLAAFVPARRAATVNPIVALRDE